MKKATSGEVPVYFTMETSLELPKHSRVGRYNWHHRELCSRRDTKWIDKKIQVSSILEFSNVVGKKKTACAYCGQMYNY